MNKTAELQSVFVQSKRYLCLFLFISLLTLVHSKSIDDELWTGIELKKKISSTIKLKVEQQLRLKEHFSQFHKTFTDFSLSYKVSPIVKFTGKYRYIVYEDKVKSRISLGCKINLETNYFLTSYRFRLQRDFERNEPQEDSVLRNKFTLGYPLIKQFTPYISYEFFHILKDESLSYNKFRIGLGIEYEINEDKSLEIYCLYKGEFVKSEIEATNIIGLQYGYSF